MLNIQRMSAQSRDIKYKIYLQDKKSNQTPFEFHLTSFN